MLFIMIHITVERYFMLRILIWFNLFIAIDGTTTDFRAHAKKAQDEEQ